MKAKNLLGHVYLPCKEDSGVCPLATFQDAEWLRPSSRPKVVSSEKQPCSRVDELGSHYAKHKTR